MKKPKGMPRERIIGITVVLLFFAAIAYFFISTSVPPGVIPDYVGGFEREIYEWAQTQEGNDILEQLPCYCGCKYEGHLHTRHCFWRDDGSFDKHGITCTVCFDIAKTAKQMNEEGKDICEIRKTVDTFYAPNAHLGTETPLPQGCE